MTIGKSDMESIASASSKASRRMQKASNAQKNEALMAIHETLKQHKDYIIAENVKDLEANKGKISDALFKRLDISKKFDDLLQGVLDVAKLDDPTQKCSLATKLDDNLELYRVSCPVGVLLIIFEARPEVVVQISCLAIKSGNSVILKGGKEAKYSNIALMETIRMALDTLGEKSAIPADGVNLVSSRDEIASLLKLDDYIDLVIPRGSKQLVKHVQESTKIPVLGHADGLCSVFVDESADLTKAINVVVDSKINYPAACNAAETLLVHKNALKHFDAIAKALVEKGVSLQVDELAFQNMPSVSSDATKVSKATEESFNTEFLDLTIAVKVVDSIQDAIEHVNSHGSKHTDCIVTEVEENAKEWMRSIDSAGVYWNASTRFADGFRYGFGAEIGVSTNKTHARGPVGLEGLVIYRYRLYGTGQAAGMYGSGKERQFIHEPITTITKDFS